LLCIRGYVESATCEQSSVQLETFPGIEGIKHTAWALRSTIVIEILNMSEESTKYWNNNYKMAQNYRLHDGLHISTAALNVSGSQERIRCL